MRRKTACRLTPCAHLGGRTGASSPLGDALFLSLSPSILPRTSGKNSIQSSWQCARCKTRCVPFSSIMTGRTVSSPDADGYHSFLPLAAAICPGMECAYSIWTSVFTTSGGRLVPRSKKLFCFTQPKRFVRNECKSYCVPHLNHPFFTKLESGFDRSDAS